jgi:glycosyltransferase involved in cell wall biosynthesis
MRTKEEQTKLIFLYSHPIQYFAPLVRQFALDERFSVDVLYCSKKGVEQSFDQQFNQQVAWDIPLLEGYNFHFFKNLSSKNKQGFWSLINPGIIPYLWKKPKGYLIIHGWGYFSLLLAFIWGKMLGYKICLRAESPMVHEQARNKKMQILRKVILGYFFFPIIDYFWYIGKENFEFYIHYGVPQSKLVFTPYSIDNDRFSEAAKRLTQNRNVLRKGLGIPKDANVAVYCGKFIPKKRPMDLLRAYNKAKSSKNYLLMIGEGELRTEMESYCKEHQLSNVILTGFINQSYIPEYYAIADFFVMCSGTGETWGLATNEAMNFGLPVLLSNMTGCRPDLLREGQNGYGFNTGDIGHLAELLSKMFQMESTKRQKMGELSRAIVQNYSYRATISNFLATLKEESKHA